MDSREVGNVIWKQMNAMDKTLIWAMGTHAPRIIEDGLRFKVKGLSFKGTVEIILNHGQDLYEVSFIKNKKKWNETAKAMGIRKYDNYTETVGFYNEVDFEQLMPLLDEYVELGGR